MGFFFWKIKYFSIYLNSIWLYFAVSILTIKYPKLLRSDRTWMTLFPWCSNRASRLISLCSLVIRVKRKVWKFHVVSLKLNFWSLDIYINYCLETDIPPCAVDDAPLFSRPSRRGFYAPVAGNLSPIRLNAFRNVGRYRNWFSCFLLIFCHF